MFQFPAYVQSMTVHGLQPCGFPHSDISGSLPVCKSPELFAAYHVLHHFRKPRHPPFALILFLVLVNHMRLNVSYYSFCLMKLLSSQTRKNSNLLQTIISFLLYLVIFLSIVNELKCALTAATHCICQTVWEKYKTHSQLYLCLEHHASIKCQSRAPKRRCSSHTFRYGYLVTT